MKFFSKLIIEIQVAQNGNSKVLEKIIILKINTFVSKMGV